MHPLCRCNFLFRLDILDLVWAYPLRTFTFKLPVIVQPNLTDIYLLRQNMFWAWVGANFSLLVAIANQSYRKKLGV